MAVHFFESEFNFKNYISERLLEISDEGERRALKELMRETLIPFYNQTEEAYMSLEQRLKESKTENRECFEIVTGIAEKKKIDITEESFVPMQYNDIYDQIVDIEELKEALEAGETYPVMRVFFQMNTKMIKQMVRENRMYKGIIYTEEEEYPALFTISQTNSYLKQIADLYPVFIENGMEWNTVCSPYLFKYFDVKIVKTEWKMDTPIKEIKVDFDEYQKYVRYDLIPMWNIRVQEERSGAYPVLAVDRIHYEHIIYRERFAANKDYLICQGDSKLWNVFRDNGDIHIICDNDKPVRWKLIEFNHDVFQEEHPFLMYSNHHHGTNDKRCIHTFAEVRRYIKELGYEKYIELKEIKLVDGVADKDKQTYAVDWFIQDEIRTMAQRQGLLFVFEATDKESYLNEDIMSYLVSKIQWKLPEYECMGELL